MHLGPKITIEDKVYQDKGMFTTTKITVRLSPWYWPWIWWQWAKVLATRIGHAIGKLITQ